ncbi:MAG: UDP-N-acetylglucosamine 2-epimerase (non-hydrolyzing) [Xanthomonadales bacterium]|nr:UDP-2,3-diacetamido-2,3-dideoxy-D-glucuronate 2-epimerase [Xanthomonadales bacterium]MCC6593176.1 UDP-N-acetylglucosamine 2-epimerase (non-hydrolyzing) [Xanthomonadales bacterium]MCE7930724.1 UDP-N-acetylglucosamine 2-epimerase (non-hydrolyzing) [Xanthomonadales bacterium PRO6]
MRAKTKLRIVCVVGARPNFMKIMPIMKAFAERAPEVEVRLVHTGQHYDVDMNDRFFGQLGIPAPDVSLEVGSGTHAQQTAEVMVRFEPVIDECRPDAVLVVGDVNSTLACALVAAKKGVRVVHVEAGLRSRDRTMPEEINRILTDQLSDRLYITEDDALANLASEGIASDKVMHAGNVMIDTLLANRARAVPAIETLTSIVGANAQEWVEQGFGLLTMHRPSNVDDPAVLETLLGVLAEASDTLPIVFPMHPRTRSKIAEFGLDRMLDRPRIALLGPLGYLEMLGLTCAARVVLTDSGGLQEETTALGVPCLTLRENTERPVTIHEGTNRLVGRDPEAIREGIRIALMQDRSTAARPHNWDGCASQRIVEDLVAWASAGQ